MDESSNFETFRTQVFLIVQQVPRGRVTTYGQIAAMIPPPTGIDPYQYSRIRARWAGRAMRHSPDRVPWHRVINSQGRISLPAGGRSGALQRIRLEAEGVSFGRNNTVDLNRFLWEGPDPLWAQENGFVPTETRPNQSPQQLELIPSQQDDLE